MLEPRSREWALDLLEEALPNAVTKPQHRTPSSGARDCLPDFELKIDGRRLLVEVKSASASRVSEVLGCFARGVLELQRHRRSRRDIPIVIVNLDRFGAKLEEEARSFFKSNAEGAGWGLQDSRGRAVLEIPAMQILWRRDAGTAPEPDLRWDRADRQGFSDLNRWMLKILMLRNAPRTHWGGPRSHPKHPTELARISNVSIETAHRLVLSLERAGHLSRGREGLRVLRLRTLLEDWLQAERRASNREVSVRPLRPMRKVGRHPLLVHAEDAAVLGGAEAARRQSLLHSTAPILPLVHLRIPLQEALQRWDLAIAERHEAVLCLREPRFPESVFRGAVAGHDQPSLVDIWQLALDSASAESRGTEQAEFILQRILQLNGES